MTRGTAPIGTAATGDLGARCIRGTLAAAVTPYIMRQRITAHGTDLIPINTGTPTTAASQAAEAETQAADCRWLTTQEESAPPARHCAKPM